MTNNKKYIKYVMIIVALITIIMCIIRINRKYPNPTTTYVSMNENINIENIKYKVVNVDFLSKEKSDEYYKENRGILGDEITYLIHIKIANEGDSEEKLSLGSFSLAKKDYATFPDFEVFLKLNDLENGMILKPGEEKEYILPYTIHQINQSDKQWEHIKDSKFMLILNLYPDKAAIKLY